MIGWTFQSCGRPLAVPDLQSGGAGLPVRRESDAFKMGFTRWGKTQQSKPTNREKNRGISRSGLEIVEFCPKSANFVQRQGINREFCGFPTKLLSTRWLGPFSGRFKK